MPHFTYTEIRRVGEPVHVDGDRAFQSSREDKETLLCDSCEGRFQRREDHIAPLLCWDDARRMKIQAACTPPTSDESPQALRLATDDAAALEYLLLSVLWRYHASRRHEDIQLGERYGEQLRQYLLGAVELPPEIVLLATLLEQGDRSVVQLCWPPAVGRGRGFHLFSFGILGLRVDAFVGGLVPEAYRGVSISDGVLIRASEGNYGPAWQHLRSPSLRSVGRMATHGLVTRHGVTKLPR